MADPQDDDTNYTETVEGGDQAKPWWQEAMRDITLTGLAAVFMTEEGVRNLLREKKMPKELMGLLLSGVGRKKDEFYGLLAKEFGRVLGKIDITKEVEKFLERHNVVVEAKVSFEPKSGATGGSVKTEEEKS